MLVATSPKTADDAKLITVLDDMKSDTYVIDNQGSTLLLQTNRNAPNQKVVIANIAKPQPKHWKDLIPETENVLLRQCLISVG